MRDPSAPPKDARSVAQTVTQRLTGSPAFADLAARAVDVRWFDRALALAARLVIAVLPMALIVSAVAPDSASLADRLSTGLRLDDAARNAAVTLFATPDTVLSGVTAFSLLVVLYALSSYGGELQRMYRAAWRLERIGPDGFAADVRRRFVWVAAFIAFLVGSALLEDVDGGALVDLGRDAARTAVAVVFFAWTPYLMLDRRVPTRRLWPTALLNASALGVFTALAPVYIAPLADGNVERYGLIGFVFTLFTYLFAQAFLVVGAGIVGAVLGDPDHASGAAPS